MLLSGGLASKLSPSHLLSLWNWWLFSVLILNFLVLPSIAKELARDWFRARATLSLKGAHGEPHPHGIKQNSSPAHGRFAGEKREDDGRHTKNDTFTKVARKRLPDLHRAGQKQLYSCEDAKQSLFLYHYWLINYGVMCHRSAEAPPSSRHTFIRDSPDSAELGATVSRETGPQASLGALSCNSPFYLAFPCSPCFDQMKGIIYLFKWFLDLGDNLLV